MMKKSHLQSPISVFWVLAVALTLSAFFIVNAWVTHYLGQQERAFDWHFESLTVLTNYFLWAILTTLIYRFLVANDKLWRLSFKTILIHLIAGVVIALLHRYGALGLYVFITWLTKGFLLNLFGEHSIAWVIRGTIPSFIQYWMLVALLWGIRYYRLEKAKQLELIKKDQEIANAQLSALKMQLHPHFFFNTLNTISSVMEKDTEEAQSIVAKLAKLMRALVDSDKKESTSLKEEIEYIKDYLDVEKARFGDSLSVEFNISTVAEQARVPNLILQPLVENAIKHGFAQVTGIKKLRIKADVIEEQLHITVADNGKGVANTQYTLLNPGVGLRSITQRLTHLYGQDSSFEIESKINQGFSVSLRLPFVKESNL